jgi:two-component sensor histidine kinase
LLRLLACTPFAAQVPRSQDGSTAPDSSASVVQGRRWKRGGLESSIFAVALRRPKAMCFRRRVVNDSNPASAHVSLATPSIFAAFIAELSSRAITLLPSTHAGELVLGTPSIFRPRRQRARGAQRPLIHIDSSRFSSRPLRRWVLFVLPLVTFALASADAVLLSVHRGDWDSEHWKLALGTTIPLSAAACALTAWIQLRLRTEIERRISSEVQLRTALEERSRAVADLTQALERERLLLRELDHRVRNNLSSLQGLLGLYEGSNVATGELVHSLRGRISALREVYGLIGAGTGEGVDIAQLLSAISASTTRPRDHAGIRADGPSVRLRSREATALAMVVHELFTNAAKHGALRASSGSPRSPRSDGSVDIVWSVKPVETDKLVQLFWDESPVAPCASPKPRDQSSGLALIQGIVRSDLRGRVAFANIGERWIVEIDMLVTGTESKPSFKRKEVHSS